MAKREGKVTVMDAVAGITARSNEIGEWQDLLCDQSKTTEEEQVYEGVEPNA